MSLLIDAHEGRDVATADVVGAYLRAYMNEEVIMKFCGEFVDILLGMKPEYKEFVIYENGVKVLYVRNASEGDLWMCQAPAPVVSTVLWHSCQNGFRVTPLRAMHG
jgi:hypothetical protein